MNYIYYGRSGTGKTYRLTQKAEKLSEQGVSVCFVVPEQLSMTREYMINERGLKNVTVLTFSRLANNIFRTLGGTARKSPDRAMSAAAVYRAVSNVYSQLRYYKSIAFTGGFISKLISVFTEFDVNCMSSACLEKLPDSEVSRSLKDKYTDLFTIYAEYKRIWTDEYKAPGDDITVCAGMLELNTIFDKTVFMFDGFYGFTPQQKLLLAQIFLQSPETCFAFTTDLESRLFETLTNEARGIERLAKKCGVRTVYESVGTQNMRTNVHSITLTEKYVFEDSHSKIDGITNDGGIKIYNAKNPTEELNYIVCKIKNDVLDGKYRYRDVAVLSPDAKGMTDALLSVFKKHGVPVFADTKRTLLELPLTAFVLHALEIAKDGFQFESVFSFLKTGLTGIPFDDISMIENYVRIWRLGSNAWKKEKWDQSPFGLGRGTDEEAQRRLELINSLKNRIYTPLGAFVKRINTAHTVRERLQAIYCLTEDFDVKGNLENAAMRFLNDGDINEYNNYLRIYDIFTDMLDSIDFIYGGTDISCFDELLSVCASQITVSSRPARADEVIFAGIGQVRAEDKKCIYIPSLNSGVIPSVMSDSSLITESDKRIFTKYGITVPMDFPTFALREKFDLYSAMFSASKELVLSSSAFRITGDSLERSEYLTMICDLTCNNGITSEDLPETFHFVTLAAASDLASVRRDIPLAKKILSLSGRLPVSDKPRDTDLSDGIVRALYTQNLKLSYSGVEEYVNCPFKFFLDKGLRLSKTEPVEFNPANIGNFIHKGLERLLCDGYDIPAMDETALKSVISKISDDYYQNELADCKGRSKRFDYLFSRARKAFENAALNVAQEIKSSEFRPFDFEVEISDYAEPARLSNGYTLTVTGSIDRVDMADANGRRLAKIVDYKSGNQTFSLKHIYNGLSMQLPIYAGAIRSKYKDVDICAVYYLKVGIPKVELSARPISDSMYADKIFNCYERDGVFESGVTNLLDNNDRFFKNIKRDRMIDSADMDALIDFSMKRMRETGEGIVSGNTKINPIRDGNTDSCKYCDFSGICKVKDENARALSDPPEKFYKES